MTQDQMILWGWVFSVLGRIPRILERWNAPLQSGPGWFFSIQVARDFLAGKGRSILAGYRLRLFLPWAFEIPACVALLATGNKAAILPLIMVIVLLTRLNYYADRKVAEDRVRQYELVASGKPVVAVALSLSPRTLRAYTNPWIEAPIALAVLGSVGWLLYRYAAVGGWQPLRGLLAVTLVSLYLQIGMLLMKRGFVRARSVTPADSAVQYRAWRESLRRLSTSICDYARLMLAFFPLLADLASATDHWQGSAAQAGSVIFAFVLTAALGWYEWRNRQQHLKVARTTKRAEFLVLPDTAEPANLICFKPSLPILLLKGPKGYVLNLASGAAKTGVLYVAGCALLMVYLTR